jgi:5-(carboxyamino)imidazole ribonucleotide synthase
MTRTVGVLGAGQLGRMLALAGAPLGLRFVFVDPNESAPAARLGRHIVAEYTDAAALEVLAQTDVVSYEFESVPAAAVDALAGKVPVFPPPRALSVARDRLEEKRLFTRLGIPTPRYMPVATPQALALAVKETGVPCVLKTRTLGYDGKGQVVVRDGDEVARLWAHVAGSLAILESFAPFSRELSVLGVRAQDGSTRFYPLIENTHTNGVLRTSRSPAPDVSPELQARAHEPVRESPARNPRSAPGRDRAAGRHGHDQLRWGPAEPRQRTQHPRRAPPRL